MLRRMFLIAVCLIMTLECESHADASKAYQQVVDISIKIDQSSSPKSNTQTSITVTDGMDYKLVEAITSAIPAATQSGVTLAVVEDEITVSPRMAWDRQLAIKLSPEMAEVFVTEKMPLEITTAICKALESIEGKKIVLKRMRPAH